MKGLAWAAEKPCVAVSTLEAMAWPLAHLEGIIVCAMDARRQQIYNAVFLSEGGALTRLREDRAISLAEAAGDLADMDDGPMVIVGDGAQLCYNYLRLQDVSCQLAPAHLRLQSAVGVGLAAFAQPGCSADGQSLYCLDGIRTVSAQELAPVYLRLSQAERERAEREQRERGE